jgi:hypothetical protein
MQNDTAPSSPFRPVGYNRETWHDSPDGWNWSLPDEEDGYSSCKRVKKRRK